MPPPPDLTRCTRIEVRYRTSVADYMSPFARDANLVTAAETAHLESLQRIVMEDSRSIRAMANAIKRGSSVESRGRVAMRPNFDIVAYRGEEQIASIPVYAADLIVTEEGDTFSYSRELPEPLTLVPDMCALTLRGLCAQNMAALYNDLDWHVKQEGSYPAADKWCDIILEAAESDGVADETIGLFACPGAGRGRCCYAMNPDCRPDSQAEIVLLFETKAGWNQHGSAELFTFDNHDPRGGLVLLNDGTVKFIRTEQELRRLRWK